MSVPGAEILKVDGLTVDFLSDDEPVRAVENVGFRVCRGETLVILGESGSGKSVSTRTVMDLVDCPPGDLVAGRIAFHDIDLRSLDRRGRREINGRRIAMIFQDPLAHLNPVLSIGRQIAEVFEVHGIARGAEARRRSLDLLKRVGIPDPETRIGQYPHQFSGGQRQRIMIAMAIALDPEVLIADEPTTALDLSVQAQILDLLRNLQAEKHMALVLITHDLDVAAAMADRIMVMKGGRIVEEGRAEDVFNRPLHDYTKRLMAAHAHTPPAARAAPDRATGECLLKVEHLVKDYGLSGGLFGGQRSLRALDDVSFDLARGETLGIVGESGSGKSTIARILLRLNDPTSGKALFDGRDIFGLSGKSLLDLRRKVQMVFQDPSGSLNPRMDVERIISEPWRIHSDMLERTHWRDRVVELLELVGLKADHTTRYPHQFSGGQQQRIAIARALASEPQLIVCDEAVSALDVSIQIQVVDLLADLKSRLGLSYLFITHDLPIVRHFADRIIVMQKGRIVEDGSTETIFGNPAHAYTRKLLDAAPRPKWSEADEG
ncbi:Glutathione import ATP-binding protein GsiA (plasmid) [Hartmannibacter diazotrophicus]|uniref:Glutathione import ATP-binding protein GsiA n=1 Tax=Hartmannibacter diazotrophicus TaxID=1482074 RepID=A0A2C9DDN3_9HYPH|nr:ABC transporter ATP-binding protein [Hartmannibacter diazotrophicus]SON58442.1 Glutathione import ATP-binding protein GsiA [Hartmannibacter diazotrophicus]